MTYAVKSVLLVVSSFDVLIEVSLGVHCIRRDGH